MDDGHIENQLPTVLHQFQASNGLYYMLKKYETLNETHKTLYSHNPTIQSHNYISTVAPPEVYSKHLYINIFVIYV